MPEPAPALAAENLVFRYGRRMAPTLNGVNLSLAPGTLTVLLGPNASGKSTLIKCLAGVHRPTGGVVRLGRQDMTGLPARKVAGMIAYAPQTVAVPFAFTVAELLALNPKRAAGAQSSPEPLLDEFDLAGMAERNLLSLSGGERQRAFSARAFAQSASILLLDEPTAHLDLRHQVTLMDACRRRAAQGRSVCVVLHDLNLASRFADTVVLLHDGGIAAQGSVNDVICPDVLGSVYDAPVQVISGPDNRPVVLPGLPGVRTKVGKYGVQDLTDS